MPLPIYTNDQIADYLTHGYWNATGSQPAAYSIPIGGTISYTFSGLNDISLYGYTDPNGLNADGQFFALAAMQVWSDATGIQFVEVSSGADLNFTDNQSGAFSQSWKSSAGGWHIVDSVVNVHTSWISGEEGEYDNYSFQTYIHEIGHALGLGHSGDYNGSADYEQDGSGDNHYLNDSWQASVMSYFSQGWPDNDWVNADFAYTITPMVADIIAIRNLYGSTYTTRTGDTTYGHNSNAGGTVGDWEHYGNNTVMAVIDDGGTDTFDFSNGIVEQMIDLREEAFSNVYGEIGTVGIARGSVIENAIGGSGTDTIYGNAAGNVLKGKDGADTLFGFGGDDEIYGGKGHDTLNGGSKHDMLKGNAGNDTIYGGSGRDYIQGGGDDDDLYGDAGRDVLVGGAGNDMLYGGAGNDKLNGQGGDDHYWGGAGDDKFIFNANQSGNDHIYDYGNGNDVIIIRNGSAGSTSVVQNGDDAIITIGAQVITVDDGWLNGIQDPADLIFT
ncbi:MAG: M10 family metallopeptidase C-terminal domain-containing protein [Paracoccaceae bacterium]